VEDGDGSVSAEVIYEPLKALELVPAIPGTGADLLLIVSLVACGFLVADLSRPVGGAGGGEATL
jgi:hypothetical protein